MRRGGSIMLCRCFAGGGTWPSQNRWHHVEKLWIYIEATSQDISQEVKAWSQLDNDPKHTSTVVAKWLKDNKVKVLEWPSKPWPQSYRNFVGRTENVCEQGGLQTWLSYTSSVRGNGPKFTQLIVGSLWKATRDVWSTLNNLKVMLPNTNWVYVNFWPTGNVMK